MMEQRDNTSFVWTTENLRENLDTLSEWRRHKVIVVSFLGLSPNDVSASFILDQLVMRKFVFEAQFCVEPCIQGHFEKRTNTLYLNLCIPDISKEEEKENKRLILMLLMIGLSHLVVAHSSTNKVERVHFLQLFKTLDKLRTRFKAHLGQLMRNKNDNDPIEGQLLKKNVREELMNNARIAKLPPKLLFFLQESRKEDDLGESHGKGDRIDLEMRKASVEQQLYRAMKRLRLTQTSSIGSGLALFRLQRDNFVFLNGPDKRIGQDIVQLCLEELKLSLKRSEVNPFKSISSEVEADNKEDFSDFLKQHIRSEQHQQAKELLTLSLWLQASSLFASAILSNYEIDEKDENSLKTRREEEKDVIKSSIGLSKLKLSHASNRFSELRCSKALPLAFSAYKDGLPGHYNEELHHKKLQVALNHLSAQGRGPALARHLEMLRSECESYYHCGREMCEQLSLTANQCLHRRHLLRGQQQPERDRSNSKRGSMSVMACSSGKSYLHACNCGRRQGHREDPFTLFDANFKFYLDLEEDCCSTLEHYQLPVYQSFDESSQESSKPSQASQEQAELKEETLQTLADPSLALSKRQKPLNHMLTADITSGQLPLFTSWSLVNLGSARLYSHSVGVNQPGFWSGYKSLLPWDVPLREMQWETLQREWPNLSEMVSKRANFNINTVRDTKLVITVKIFIGLEYECVRGHRFIASEAVRSERGAKEAASKMVHSDRPLYLPCVCNNGRSASVVAQLMRIHIVTPKAPMNVTLMPRVQACRQGPIFHLGVDQPIRLAPNAYWVLRLPFIYSGAAGAHVAPNDLNRRSEHELIDLGALLKDAVGFDADNFAENNKP